jgi:hypothetical protein
VGNQGSSQTGRWGTFEASQTGSFVGQTLWYCHPIK